MPDAPALPSRAAELVRALDLQPHPEGGFYRELFRSPHEVANARGTRRALTTIDFLLARGQCSAWHRVVSDEAWHLLEGGPLRLWLLSPTLDAVSHVDLGRADGTMAPRHVVPAMWWQAAEPMGNAGFAYVGATVGPGFEFADFSFLRADTFGAAALQRLRPDLMRLL